MTFKPQVGDRFKIFGGPWYVIFHVEDKGLQQFYYFDGNSPLEGYANCYYVEEFIGSLYVFDTFGRT